MTRSMKGLVKALALGLAAACSLAAVSGATAEELSLKGKRIGVSAIGTDHYWDLMAFKGIGDKYSDQIIAGRPYAKKDQLVSKKILPEATYKKIAGQIIASQPK